MKKGELLTLGEAYSELYDKGNTVIDEDGVSFKVLNGDLCDSDESTDKWTKKEILLHSNITYFLAEEKEWRTPNKLEEVLNHKGDIQFSQSASFWTTCSTPYCGDIELKECRQKVTRVFTLEALIDLNNWRIR